MHGNFFSPLWEKAAGGSSLGWPLLAVLSFAVSEGISSPVNPLQTSASQEQPAEIRERAFWSVPSVISWQVPVHLQEVWPSSVRTRPDARNNCRRAWLWDRLFFSDLVSSYSQNYLHDTWFVIKITDRMCWWKHFFFPAQDFSYWTTAGEIGGRGVCWVPRHDSPPCLMDSQLNPSAWCKLKFLQSHWHNMQRGGGTHSRKRYWCAGAHFSEELFCSLRWMLLGLLGNVSTDSREDRR